MFPWADRLFMTRTRTRNNKTRLHHWFKLWTEFTFLRSGLISPSTSTQTSSHAHVDFSLLQSFNHGSSVAGRNAAWAPPLRRACRRSMHPFTSRPLCVMYTVWSAIRRLADTDWKPVPNTSDSRNVCTEPSASKRTVYDCCANVRVAESVALGWTDSITPG